MHVLIDAINDNAHVRGPDRYLLGLLEGLATLDHDDHYTVVHAPWQAAFADPGPDPRFSAIQTEPPRGRIGRVLWHATRFPALVRRVDPDVVHLPNIIAVPRLGVPTVMTVHDLAHFRFPEKFGSIRGRIQRILIRTAVRQSDRIIAVSDFTRSDLERFTKAPTERTTVIGEGGPTADVRTPAPDLPPFLLYVGQVERSKNIEGLIDAFAASETLRARGVELWVAGKPGNAQARVEGRLTRVGDGRIRLLGYVDEDRLKTLYASCIAFVFPSLVEGFGLVLLEAMAHGAPVVAMNATAVPEVVGSAGLLVDGERPAALREAIERIALDGDLRQDLRQRGYARLKDFSWRETAVATRSLYVHALAGESHVD